MQGSDATALETKIKKHYSAADEADAPKSTVAGHVSSNAGNILCYLLLDIISYLFRCRVLFSIQMAHYMKLYII